MADFAGNAHSIEGALSLGVPCPWELGPVGYIALFTLNLVEQPPQPTNQKSKIDLNFEVSLRARSSAQATSTPINWGWVLLKFIGITGPAVDFVDLLFSLY